MRESRLGRGQKRWNRSAVSRRTLKQIRGRIWKYGSVIPVDPVRHGTAGIDVLKSDGEITVEKVVPERNQFVNARLGMPKITIICHIVKSRINIIWEA